MEFWAFFVKDSAWPLKHSFNNSVCEFLDYMDLIPNSMNRPIAEEPPGPAVLVGFTTLCTGGKKSYHLESRRQRRPCLGHFDFRKSRRRGALLRYRCIRCMNCTKFSTKSSPEDRTIYLTVPSQNEDFLILAE